MAALQELALPYDVDAAHLEEGCRQDMLLLAAYLFAALPQLLPRATLDFSARLGETQVGGGLAGGRLRGV